MTPMFADLSRGQWGLRRHGRLPTSFCSKASGRMAVPRPFRSKTPARCVTR